MPSIPKIFHFVFGLKPQTEPFHLAFYICIESCRRTNDPEEIFFYCHYEPYGRYWDLVRRRVKLVQVPLDAFISDYRYRDRGIDPYRYAHHSDFVRLERVLETGGVYADLDTVFVNPFPERLWNQRFVLGREPDIVTSSSQHPQKSLCNAVIMAEPRAEFGRLWLAEMRRSFDGSWSAHSTLLPERLSREHPDLIHIEPPETFYKHPWTVAGLRTLFEGLDSDYSSLVSMHLWSHLWWSKRRRDFSDFHAGRLTPRYIAEVDTTYNVAARRYLPSALGYGERFAWRLREIVRAHR